MVSIQIVKLSTGSIGIPLIEWSQKQKQLLDPYDLMLDYSFRWSRMYREAVLT